MYKYWCSDGSFQSKCQWKKKCIKNHFGAVGPKMHSKAKTWINHSSGEGISEKQNGEHTYSLKLSCGEGGSPDVFL